MSFYRELASGAILCALCFAAAIFSFSTPSRRVAEGDAPHVVPESVSILVRPVRSPAAKPAVNAPETPPAAVNDAAPKAGPVPVAEHVTELPATDVPEHATEPPATDNEVRWLRFPVAMEEPTAPMVAADAMPLVGNQALPELPLDDTHILIVSEPQRELAAPTEPLASAEVAGELDLIQPEFLAAKPSLPLPGPADLMVTDPVEHAPTDRESFEAESSDRSAPEAAEEADALAGRQIPIWHAPSELLERVERLADYPETQTWAGAVVWQIEAIGIAVQDQTEDTPQLLDAFENAIAEAMALAGRVSEPALAARLQRTAHAMRRRLEVWRYADRLAGDPNRAAAARADWDELALSLDRVGQYVGESPVGQQWREYLLIDSLRHWAARRQADDEHVGRELVEASLNRLTRIPMDPQQRTFVATRPVAELKARLQRLAAMPADYGRMLSNLERYEQSRSPDEARQLARDYRQLALAESAWERELAKKLARHYRNANIRFAVSEDLLNRLMPTRHPEIAPVNDIVLGVAAHGRRATSTEMQVRLIPDPRRARLALDVHGRILSRTTSSSGPATFLTNSLGSYVARKPLEIDLDGIRAEPAEVRVSNDLRLQGVRTDFDGLPLLGSLANSIARSQHVQNQPAANAEIRAKIHRQARARIDCEADTQLAEVSDRLRTRLLEPMRRLRLEPAMIDAATTEDRLTMRIRLAGEEHLGSHTPRPCAPADSLASVQLHESAINNVLHRLDLNGRTFTLVELSQHVAARMNNEGWLQLGPEHEDVTVTFAAKNAVVAHCQDGRASITLLVDRFIHDRRVWRDFQVQAFYRPETRGVSAKLVRDGVIQLSGDRLPLGSQIALRGIFERIFARQRSWDLMPELIAETPNLADLEVTQFIVEDGWIGLALGPQRTAGRATALLR